MKSREEWEMYLKEAMIMEASAVYHGNRGPWFTSGLMKELHKSPAHYHGKVTGSIKDVSRPAFVLGGLVHSRILEGKDRMAEDYTWDCPINEKTGEPYGAATKAYRQWADDQDKIVVTPDMVEQAELLAGGLAKSKLASKLISNGIPEGVLRTNLTPRLATGELDVTIPCQIRMDWFNFTEGLVDLKTCEDLDWFVNDAKRYRYIHQLAFYRDVAEASLGEYIKDVWPDTRLPVWLVAVEKKAPYRAGVWRVGDYILNIASQENAVLMEELHHCMVNDEWPTRYEEQRSFDTL